MENALQSLPDGWVRGKTWRVIKPNPSTNHQEVLTERHNSQWKLLKAAVRSILIFSDDCDELLETAEKYQGTRPSPVITLLPYLSQRF